MNRLPIVILISGRGSNLGALLTQARSGALPVDIRAVISNNPQAAGLERAATAGVHTQVVDHRDYPDRSSYDAALRDAIDAYAPELVVLAGFMRILSADFVRHYRGRLINIHPSLLPRHRGLDTHQRVLDAGDTEHGASVHFVTEELDGGPVIAQARLRVAAGDDAKRLAARILELEHRLYPTVIEWIAAGRLRYRDDSPWLDDRPLIEPKQLDASEAPNRRA